MSAEFQHGWYIGNIGISILYGIELVIYGASMKVLFRRKQQQNKTDTFFMVFSTVLLLCCTINLAANCVFGEEWWIVNQNYPGGSEQWFAENAAVWYQTWASAANILVQLLADALLIYRCFVLWSNFYIIALPCLVWLASLGLGISTLYYSGSPGGNDYAGLAQTTSTAYLSCTMAINISMSALICGRILWFARTTERVLMNGSTRQYFGIVTIIVESALLYTVFGIMYLVTFAVGSDLGALFMSFYAMFTVISPQLIILRVVKGSAWGRTTHNNMTTISFADRSISGNATNGSRTMNNSDHISMSKTSLRDNSMRESKLDSPSVYEAV
ncbi:uncharacterized protein B0H18DRAFT_885862 [Fomitopsis serialis]|uniref:uncharacterized protein n=1 Tax=Fomitopsis serialis TaxID=139415 RepID=UPI00200861F4|nr:uncharacterized protein B0H18DRAFT_885862 [Neoantrodia serialis]KAH9915533.1 hypothetical protein B0H18DRAFT_885862 [Neoantrodia serialis]